MKAKLDPAEAALFRAEVRDVHRLEQDRVMPRRKRLRPVPQQRYQDEQQVLQDMLSDQYDPADLETGDELLYLRPGVQYTVLRKLRQGMYSVIGELDLHGLVTWEAREAVSAFLRECSETGGGCVRIIHGKGLGSHQKLPVLKNKINHWLQQFDAVLAFCSARPVDGGTGAVYVLLKRH